MTLQTNHTKKLIYTSVEDSHESDDNPPDLGWDSNSPLAEAGDKESCVNTKSIEEYLDDPYDSSSPPPLIPIQTFSSNQQNDQLESNRKIKKRQRTSRRPGGTRTNQRIAKRPKSDQSVDKIDGFNIWSFTSLEELQNLEAMSQNQSINSPVLKPRDHSQPLHLSVTSNQNPYDVFRQNVLNRISQFEDAILGCVDPTLPFSQSFKVFSDTIKKNLPFLIPETKA